MKNLVNKALVVLALATLSIVACDDETKVCNSKTDTYASVSFKYLDTAGKTDVVRDTVLPSLTVYAIERDSIYAQAANYYVINLPLNGKSDTSQFYLKPGATFAADTLTFVYKRVPHFISAGCGFVNYFNIDTIFTTRNEVDSVVINSTQVTTDNATTLTLFF